MQVFVTLGLFFGGVCVFRCVCVCVRVAIFQKTHWFYFGKSSFNENRVPEDVGKKEGFETIM